MEKKDFYQPDHVESSRQLTAFCEAFWKNDMTCNHFISTINKHSPYGERVRREKNPTIIYCIGIEVPKDRDGKWLLCKVGLTQGDKNEPGNRMDRVKNKITKACKDQVPKTIFELPVSAIDTSSIFDIEDRVRQLIGIRVKREVIASWQLPNKTEWVITTKEFVEKIRPETTKNDATTDLFKITDHTFMTAYADQEAADRVRKFCADHPLPANLILDGCVIKRIPETTQHTSTSPRQESVAQQNLHSSTQSSRENTTSSTLPQKWKGESKMRLSDSKESRNEKGTEQPPRTYDDKETLQTGTYGRTMSGSESKAQPLRLQTTTSEHSRQQSRLRPPSLVVIPEQGHTAQHPYKPVPSGFSPQPKLHSSAQSTREDIRTTPSKTIKAPQPSTYSSVLTANEKLSSNREESRSGRGPYLTPLVYIAAKHKNNTSGQTTTVSQSEAQPLIAQTTSSKNPTEQSRPRTSSSAVITDPGITAQHPHITAPSGSSPQPKIPYRARSNTKATHTTSKTIKAHKGKPSASSSASKAKKRLLVDRLTGSQDDNGGLQAKHRRVENSLGKSYCQKTNESEFETQPLNTNVTSEKQYSSSRSTKNDKKTSLFLEKQMAQKVQRPSSSGVIDLTNVDGTLTPKKARSHTSATVPNRKNRTVGGGKERLFPTTKLPSNASVGPSSNEKRTYQTQRMYHDKNKQQLNLYGQTTTVSQPGAQPLIVQTTSTQNPIMQSRMRHPSPAVVTGHTEQHPKNPAPSGSYPQPKIQSIRGDVHTTTARTIKAHQGNPSTSFMFSSVSKAKKTLLNKREESRSKRVTVARPYTHGDNVGQQAKKRRVVNTLGKVQTTESKSVEQPLNTHTTVSEEQNPRLRSPKPLKTKTMQGKSSFPPSSITTGSESKQQLTVSGKQKTQMVQMPSTPIMSKGWRSNVPQQQQWIVEHQSHTAIHIRGMEQGDKELFEKVISRCVEAGIKKCAMDNGRIFIARNLSQNKRLYICKEEEIDGTIAEAKR